MFSNNLSSIEDVSIFAIIGLVIFFALFIWIILSTLKADKKYIERMENLPLEDDENTEEINKNFGTNYEK